MDTEGCADTVEFFAGLASTIAGNINIELHKRILYKSLIKPVMSCTLQNILAPK